MWKMWKMVNTMSNDLSTERFIINGKGYLIKEEISICKGCAFNGNVV